MSERETILRALRDGVIAGDLEGTRRTAELSLTAGIPPLVALEQGLTAGIREIGDRFGCGEAYLPEMVLAADAMQAAVEVLEPHMRAGEMRKKAKILIGTVQGDIHDIGKNIAAAVLKVNGYEVVDIGRDVPPATFVDAAALHKVDIVGLSSLLTTSLPYIDETIEILTTDGVRGKYKVVIGGGPTSQLYADKVGADGYANTASDAVVLCDRLMGITR